MDQLQDFVDEYQSHIPTNSIERQWRKLHNQVSSIRRSFSPEIIQQYLDCFVMKKAMLNYINLCYCYCG